MYPKFTARRFVSSLLVVLLFSVGKANAEGKFILVNQFGYLPDAAKVAIVRLPRVGPDASSSYSAAGSAIKVIDAQTGLEVYRGTPVLVGGRDTEGNYYPNQIDPTSGDKVWHFDFSTVITPGTYYLQDVNNIERSFQFKIASDVYKDVLKVAFKNFYFQRFNIAKEMPHCIKSNWADAVCYSQETKALNYMNKTNQSLMRDVSGGWFDAGDLNKYVNFLDMVFRNLLLAYEENPSVWTDDMGIPESGNGIPDILDEIKWGLDWLLKMQNTNGSVLSVVGGSNGASPPSADKAQRYYGPENTSSTLTFALVCAHAAQVFQDEPQQSLKDYAALLRTNAEKAWNWADANPNVKFYNNDNSLQAGSAGLCAGQGEVDDVAPIKLRAAVYLYGLTRNDKYGYYVRDHYTEFPMVAWWGTLSEYRISDHEACFYLNSLPDLPDYLTPAVTTLRNRMKSRLTSDSFDYSLNCLTTYKTDAYMSYIDDYNWGSNSYKAGIGNCLRQVASSDWVDKTAGKTYMELSANYVHYICGVNPMQLVYLTNMGDWGADKSVTQLYHTWFGDKTALDNNPIPGYIPGGPNRYSQNADGTSHFASTVPHSKCYIDFNTSWSNTVKPNSSWSLTENSLGYQAPFIRLLANFVPGGSSSDIPSVEKKKEAVLFHYNPVSEELYIYYPKLKEQSDVRIYTLEGRLVYATVQTQPKEHHSVAGIKKGYYVMVIENSEMVNSGKLLIE